MPNPDQHWWRHASLLLKQELKRGELTIIVFALLLAVATVFSLSGFAGAIKYSLMQNASELLAADRVLRSSHSIDQTWVTQAQTIGLKTAEQAEMSSMVFAGDNMHLVNVKAVAASYPLRGELLVRAKERIQSSHAPELGRAFVDAEVLQKFGLKLGDSIELGMARFIIDGVIDTMPDANFNPFNSRATVMINWQDLAKTQLVLPGSRVSYRYLFAGSEAQLEQFYQTIKPKLSPNQSWLTVKSQRSPLAGALTRAEQFLSLASMLGILLASLAVAVASNRYAQRQQNVVSIFKALGASKSYVTKLYISHWSSLTLLSIVSGLLLGALALAVGLKFTQSYLGHIPLTEFVPALLKASITGLICAACFALAPFSQLLATSPLAIWRQQVEPKLARWRLIPAMLAVLALLWLFSQDIKLTLILFGSSALAIGLLLLLARLMLLLTKKVGSQASSSFKLALANLQKRASSNAVQLVTFTLALQLLLLLAVVRNDLLNEWQAQLPQNVANRFLVNIAPEQVASINDYLAEQQIEASQLYPIVRARLTAINEQQVTDNQGQESDAQVQKTEQQSANQSDQSSTTRQGIGREINLTYAEQLPDYNELIAGKAWDKALTAPEVSIEQGVAKRLGVELGDTLTFDLASQHFSAKVTSIRKVDWQSMKPNFFMIFNPVVLQDFAVTYIASLHLADDKKQSFSQFLAQYPTITVLNIDEMIAKFKALVDQVGYAIGFILLVVVLAGSLVLIAQVQASLEQRERELAILKTLGASAKFLSRSVLLEFMLLGSLAGMLAAGLMELSVWGIQSQVFNMQWHWHPSFWLLAVLAGAGFVGCLGFLACRRLLQLPPVVLIRRTMS